MKKKEEKKEEAKGQRTCKNPRGVKLTYICINHRDHFHGVGFNRILVERKAPFLGTPQLKIDELQQTAARKTSQLKCPY